MFGMGLKKLVCSIALAAFLATSVMPPSYAQALLDLPQAGTMITISPAATPLILRGVKVDPSDPFRFDFMIDPGDRTMGEDELKTESTKLVRYFLAAMTTPEEDVWVNLSPYEQDRIVPDALGITEMGRDLLAQDYILKQITSSLMFPESEPGKTFWSRIYKQAYDVYGTTDVPLDTFNKVWITPAMAEVYEDNGVVVIGDSRLKVMLESDYMAKRQVYAQGDELETTDAITKDGVRQVILPVIEKEVNEGENFAKLRQIYHAMILAAWYKKRLKESIFSRVYADQNKTGGIDIEDKEEKTRIWERYVASFKKGTYNYIREEEDLYTQELIPRKYFSGGFKGGDMAETTRLNPLSVIRSSKFFAQSGKILTLTFLLNAFQAKAKDEKNINGTSIAAPALNASVSLINEYRNRMPEDFKQDMTGFFNDFERLTEVSFKGVEKITDDARGFSFRAIIGEKMFLLVDYKKMSGSLVVNFFDANKNKWTPIFAEGNVKKKIALEDVLSSLIITRPQIREGLTEISNGLKKMGVDFDADSLALKTAGVFTDGSDFSLEIKSGSYSIGTVTVRVARAPDRKFEFRYAISLNGSMGKIGVQIAERDEISGKKRIRNEAIMQNAAHKIGEVFTLMDGTVWNNLDELFTSKGYVPGTYVHEGFILGPSDWLTRDQFLQAVKDFLVLPERFEAIVAKVAEEFHLPIATVRENMYGSLHGLSDPKADLEQADRNPVLAGPTSNIPGDVKEMQVFSNELSFEPGPSEEIESGSVIVDISGSNTDSEINQKIERAIVSLKKIAEFYPNIKIDLMSVTNEKEPFFAWGDKKTEGMSFEAALEFLEYLKKGLKDGTIRFEGATFLNDRLERAGQGGRAIIVAITDGKNDLNSTHNGHVAEVDAKKTVEQAGKLVRNGNLVFFVKTGNFSPTVAGMSDVGFINADNKNFDDVFFGMLQDEQFFTIEPAAFDRTYAWLNDQGNRMQLFGEDGNSLSPGAVAEDSFFDQPAQAGTAAIASAGGSIKWGDLYKGLSPGSKIEKIFVRLKPAKAPVIANNPDSQQGVLFLDMSGSMNLNGFIKDYINTMITTIEANNIQHVVMAHAGNKISFDLKDPEKKASFLEAIEQIRELSQAKEIILEKLSPDAGAIYSMLTAQAKTDLLTPLNKIREVVKKFNKGGGEKRLYLVTDCFHNSTPKNAEVLDPAWLRSLVGDFVEKEIKVDLIGLTPDFLKNGGITDPDAYKGVNDLKNVKEIMDLLYKFSLITGGKAYIGTPGEAFKTAFAPYRIANTPVLKEYEYILKIVGPDDQIVYRTGDIKNMRAPQLQEKVATTFGLEGPEGVARIKAVGTMGADGWTEAPRIEIVDKAQKLYGGINMDTSMLDLRVKGDGSLRVGAVDPEIMAQLQDASGFVPVLIGIKPMGDLFAFIGKN